MLRLNVHTQFGMAFDMVYFCRYIYRCLIPGSFGQTKLFWPDSALLVIPGSLGHTRLDRVSGFPIVVGDD